MPRQYGGNECAIKFNSYDALNYVQGKYPYVYVLYLVLTEYTLVGF